MKIIDCQQGTLQWIHSRVGLPTASELDALISPTGEVRTGKGPRSYLALKLAEKWLGAPVHSFSGGAMEQGSILEGEARPYMELLWNTDIRQVGLVLTDDGTFGASPDGLTDGYGVEIKCPQPHTHVGWLMEGVCPPDHIIQVHGGMFATGLPEWKFCSYCRNFPPLVVVVKRDEKLMDRMRERLEAFTFSLVSEYAKLIERNGGPPQRPTPSTSEELNDHPFI